MADRNGPNQDESEDQAPASRKKFHVYTTEQTNVPHESVVELFKSLGQTEDCPEDADYWLVLCNVYPQVQKHINDAMEHLPNGKEAVLVVIHQTSNPEDKIPPSSRLVVDWRVPLKLDVLFYQDKLLTCKFNDKMEADVQKFLRSPKSKSQRKETEGGQETSSLQSKEAPWRTFHVILTGKTNGAHKSVVKTFKSLGQTEVDSPGDADYCLVFCPVSSRVGTDVSDAMERVPGDKRAVLVVMHHTFNREQVIPPSSRLVEERRVRLTLDVLFYQDKLLKCKFNDKMKADVKKFFRSSTPEQIDPSRTDRRSYFFSQQTQKEVFQVKDLKSQDEKSRSRPPRSQPPRSPPPSRPPLPNPLAVQRRNQQQHGDSLT